MLSHFRHILNTKGPLHSIERLVEVAWRFGNGRSRFVRTIEEIDEVCRIVPLKMTFFVTAVLLERHRNLIEKLKGMGHEIAAHGHYHVRLDDLDVEQQAGQVETSHRLFSDVGMEVSGFRAPYLGYNQETVRALRSSGYAWMSGEMILPPKFLGNNGIEHLKGLYHFVEQDAAPCLPRKSQDLIEIPITAPDDEILIERYRVRESADLSEVWIDRINHIFANGELCHIFFHPERFGFIKEGLKGVLEEARNQEFPIWAPTLGQLAAWWESRASSVWSLDQSGMHPRLLIQAPAEASILLKKANSLGIRNAHEEVRPIGTMGDHLEFKAGEGKLTFTIGISERCPESVEKALWEEGFFAVRSKIPERHSLYLDWDEGITGENRGKLIRQIDACDKPLLRFWRWPNGAQATFCLSSDVCAIDIWDFFARTRHFG